MAILMGNKVEEDKIEVMSVCYTMDTPIDENWYQVDSVPDYPQIQSDERAIRYFIPSTKQFEFVIVKRELSDEEKQSPEMLLKDATSLLMEMGAL